METKTQTVSSKPMVFIFFVESPITNA